MRVDDLDALALAELGGLALAGRDCLHRHSQTLDLHYFCDSVCQVLVRTLGQPSDPPVGLIINPLSQHLEHL